MPTYEYRCNACGHHFEKVQRITEDAVKECPECAEPQAQRLISQGNFILKGGGWYTEGYGLGGSGSKSNGTKSAKSSSSTKTSDSSSSSSTSSESSSSSSGDKSSSSGSSDKPAKSSKAGGD